MLRRDELPGTQVDHLRDRIAQERKMLRARLAQTPHRKGGAKLNERSKLREIFRQYEGLSDE